VNADSQSTALIIARSDPMRDSLLVLLRASSQIEQSYEAEDVRAAVAMAPEVQPALVLLDCDLAGAEAHESLGLIRARWPAARTVVLVDDEDERARAQQCGADLVLLKGVRADTILEAIEGLLLEDTPGQS